MKLAIKIERKEIVNCDEIHGSITFAGDSGETLLTADTCELLYRHLPAGTYECKVCDAAESILGLRLTSRRNWKIVASTDSQQRLANRIVVGKKLASGYFSSPERLREDFFKLLLTPWLDKEAQHEIEVEISALPQPSPTGEGDQDDEDEDD